MKTTQLPTAPYWILASLLLAPLSQAGAEDANLVADCGSKLTITLAMTCDESTGADYDTHNVGLTFSRSGNLDYPLPSFSKAKYDAEKKLCTAEFTTSNAKLIGEIADNKVFPNATVAPGKGTWDNFRGPRFKDADSTALKLDGCNLTYSMEQVSSVADQYAVEQQCNKSWSNTPGKPASPVLDAATPVLQLPTLGGVIANPGGYYGINLTKEPKSDFIARCKKNPKAVPQVTSPSLFASVTGLSLKPEFKAPLLQLNPDAGNAAGGALVLPLKLNTDF